MGSDISALPSFDIKSLIGDSDLVSPTDFFHVVPSSQDDYEFEIGDKVQYIDTDESFMSDDEIIADLIQSGYEPIEKEDSSSLKLEKYLF